MHTRKTLFAVVIFELLVISSPFTAVLQVRRSNRDNLEIVSIKRCCYP